MNRPNNHEMLLALEKVQRGKQCRQQSILGKLKDLMLADRLLAEFALNLRIIVVVKLLPELDQVASHITEYVRTEGGERWVGNLSFLRIGSDGRFDPVRAGVGQAGRDDGAQSIEDLHGPESIISVFALEAVQVTVEDGIDEGRRGLELIFESVQFSADINNLRARILTTALGIVRLRIALGKDHELGLELGEITGTGIRKQ
ncbi:unnamed protein product [Clonostachys rosea f. rosea IK726]|uniref:Uncharacterized protein n=1 Tax=Clonostachys rosea f. rosea IK726 TaxID=1349383 RepID=A0ACA9T8P6_BIOOC|nr:unnamed protein product [Clonostachys rosea f. rosea IK726]